MIEYILIARRDCVFCGGDGVESTMAIQGNITINVCPECHGKGYREYKIDLRDALMELGYGRQDS